ncbi:hypothetical protein FE839_08330 [Klebsiella indica]|uniref:Uncharacterized protein n=1 Tax=Klebsiella indica TaxID=2582917 RepID=A0A5R9LKL5_9ENTR|nr:hypothetical protein FE839_08330 [Klebsiella indica]
MAYNPVPLLTLNSVIFFTSFSDACRQLIEMILVISLMKQMNVLNNERLLMICVKNSLFSDI